MKSLKVFILKINFFLSFFWEKWDRAYLALLAFYWVSSFQNKY